MPLDTLDRRLLNAIQADFPLTEKPYADLGNRLGISADEVLSCLTQLKAEHIVRMIGPVIDARRLGFESSLVAAKVSEDRIEHAEQIISQHPGVSHGYERNHQFNIWFTLAVRQQDDIDAELEKINREIGAEKIISLKSIKVYKIGAYFDMEGDSGAPAPNKSSLAAKPLQLSQIDKAIINELQQDLPLTSTPFNAIAGRVGLEVGPFLLKCRSLIREGAIRRFSASINHRQAGFSANAMSCWAVPSDRVDGIGGKLAGLKEVSHCYERQTNLDWRYNLFAMVHGHSKENCQEIIDRICKETGLYDSIVLYSTKEFKKQRVKYLL
jgi:DNA-binding Lrp family transcriptional regulator